jgi:hypothetical protein
VSSPIHNKIGAVFVPVTDLQRAITWYSWLLGVPMGTTSHEGTIHDIAMGGEIRLILDANKPVKNSSQPLFFLWTADVHATREFLREREIPIDREIENIGSVSTLTFHDPDNNLLMVCQSNLS